MFDSKPMASLSAGLLARKGEARPAISRAYVPLTAAAPLRKNDRATLGRSDVGGDAPAATVPEQQQKQIARAFRPSPKRDPNPVASAMGSKAAFTLRLDGDRHLRLRLASAVGKRSAQRIVTEALDAFLDAQPGLDALVQQVREAADVKD